jgi:hypothetical protein
MGLTLAYELRLPGEMPEHAVLDVVRRLRDHADTLGFAHVSPIFHVSPGEEILVHPPLVRPGENYFRSRVSLPAILLEKDGEDRADEESIDRYRDADYRAVDTALGFTVDPGDGCELAPFGFRAPLRPEATPGEPAGRPPSDWYWGSWCKTQYASTVSDEHFVRCHTLLVALLDSMPKLGIRLTVSDDGDYWETREVPRLLTALRRHNVIMAMMARTLRDTLPPETPIEAPILEHPQFDALASWRPGDADPASIDELVEQALENFDLDDDEPTDSNE